MELSPGFDPIRVAGDINASFGDDLFELGEIGDMLVDDWLIDRKQCNKALISTC